MAQPRILLPTQRGNGVHLSSFMTHWIPERENMWPRPFWRSQNTFWKCNYKKPVTFFSCWFKQNKATVTCVMFELCSPMVWIPLWDVNMNYIMVSRWISWILVDKASGILELTSKEHCGLGFAKFPGSLACTSPN